MLKLRKKADMGLPSRLFLEEVKLQFCNTDESIPLVEKLCFSFRDESSVFRPGPRSVSSENVRLHMPFSYKKKLRKITGEQTEARKKRVKCSGQTLVGFSLTLDHGDYRCQQWGQI